MAEIKITLPAVRVNAGLTQEQVAEAIGRDRATVCNWESYKTSPSIEQLKKYCEICNNFPIENVKF